MSELVVVGFREPHRGLQVMSELWRLSKGLMADLDKAVVLSWNAEGKLIVCQNVNLSTGEGVTWGRFWGGFIRTTLLCIHTEQMTAAARAVAGAAGASFDEVSATDTGEIDARWWDRDIGLPTGFLRDVGAIIQPGDSAILALLQQSDYLPLIQKLPLYGGTILHTALDEEQDAKVTAFLAGSEPLSAVAGRERLPR
jgi:uncharacterized membrane protein